MVPRRQLCYPVVAALAAGPLRHIYDFKDILSQKLYLIDTKAHAGHIGESSYREDNEQFSSDVFLFARCCAVANGQTQYEQVKRDPAAMPKDLEFAPLLRIANEAYLQIANATSIEDARPVERVFMGDPDVSEAIYRMLKAAREGRRQQEEMRVAPHAQAPVRWLRLRVRPLSQSRRDAKFSVWTVADITREREGLENVCQE